MKEFRFVNLEGGGVGLEDVSSPGEGYAFESHAEAILFVQGQKNWEFFRADEARVRFEPV